MGKYRISYVEMNPWLIPPENGTTRLRGVGGDICHSLKERGLFDYDIYFETVFGTLQSNNKWNGLMGSMVYNTTDIGLPMSNTEERKRFVDFTVPMEISQFALVSGLIPTNSSPFLMFGIFSYKVWITIFLTLLLTSGTACLIYSVHPTLQKRKRNEVFLKFLWAGSVSIIGKTFGSNEQWFVHHIWKTSSFKLLLSTWLISCLVMTFAYQGAILSALATSKLKPKIESMDDLMEDTSMRIGVINNTFSWICLRDRRNRFESVVSRAEKTLLGNIYTDNQYRWADDVEEGKSTVVLEYRAAKNLISRRFLKYGKCGLRVTAADLCPNIIVMGHRKLLPKEFTSKLNYGILRYIEGGLQMRTLVEASFYYDICTENTENIQKPLGLNDLIGAFILLGAGLILSSLILLLEIHFRSP